MPTIGPLELVVVLVIALIVLGPKRLPEAGRSLGQGLRGFKDSLTGADSDQPAVGRSGDEATTGAASATQLDGQG
ncbi:MAG: sec-independent protein translocase protein TatA [Solirubrobacteraceae bacterium]